jgi:hypothetical protein
VRVCSTQDHSSLHVSVAAAWPVCGCKPAAGGWGRLEPRAATDSRVLPFARLQRVLDRSKAFLSACCNNFAGGVRSPHPYGVCWPVN